MIQPRQVHLRQHGSPLTRSRGRVGVVSLRGRVGVVSLRGRVEVVSLKQRFTILFSPPGAYPLRSKTVVKIHPSLTKSVHR